MSADPAAIKAAQEKLDAHLRDIIQWHFSPETGCPFWLDWARKNFDPRKEIRSFADMVKFPHFEDEWLRDLQPEVWVPAKYKGRPFNVFETGGTTGMPKQRIGWDDYKVDYEEFSGKIADDHFPRGGAWLMVGPTGPRRLRLAIEHLANFRGSSCYFVDLDPRWVKKVISNKQLDQAKAYMEHVVDPKKTGELVDYGAWGRVELTTLTKEFFMPRFLERDEAIRSEPRAPYAWDGVAEVRPFGAMEKQIVEGVY